MQETQYSVRALCPVFLCFTVCFVTTVSRRGRASSSSQAGRLFCFVCLLSHFCYPSARSSQLTPSRLPVSAIEDHTAMG